MKKIFSVFILAGIMMFSTTCFASMFDDLKNNSNYIYYGGAGTGISFFLDKTSINVNKYEPPVYIIAFINMSYSAGFPKGGTPESVSPKTVWYKYNYDSRKMYLGRQNVDGILSWEYIDPQEVNLNSTLNSVVTGGELAFYLAYNMSFYDKPVTFLTKKYINERL